MRQLTNEEIKQFASRAGVRKVAVENFLGSLGHAESANGELYNLHIDAALYRWNSATMQAIAAGIKLAYKSK